jgi:hypothetical protein
MKPLLFALFICLFNLLAMGPAHAEGSANSQLLDAIQVAQIFRMATNGCERACEKRGGSITDCRDQCDSSDGCESACEKRGGSITDCRDACDSSAGCESACEKNGGSITDCRDQCN